jgi:hypothetical protein
MVSFAMMVNIDLCPRLKHILKKKVASLKFKDHSVKNHKPFNKILSKLRISTPTTLSSLSRKVVLMLGLGSEKELMKPNKLTLHQWVQNFNQVLLLLSLRSMKRLMSSGLLLTVRLNIQTQKQWVMLQVSNQDFSKLVMLVDTVT